jgi:SAM-dependent methyltransferase
LKPRLDSHAFVHLRRLRQQLELEARRCPEGLVLDVGCGNQPYRRLFAGPYLGLDIASSPTVPVACLGAAESLPIRDGVAAAVLSTQNLEHVEDPGAALTEAFRVLKPGGVFLLSTHGVWPYHPSPHDYWRWTEEGLIRLFTGHGFDVVRVHRQGEIFSAGFGLIAHPFSGMRQGRRGPTRWAASLIVMILNLLALSFDRGIGRFLHDHYASPSYLVVAARPQDGYSRHGRADNVRSHAANSG